MPSKFNSSGSLLIWILLVLTLLILIAGTGFYLYNPGKQKSVSETKVIPGVDSGASTPAPSKKPGLPLGPDSEAFFDNIEQQMAQNLSSGSGVMMSYGGEVCDINEDGVCNTDDKREITTRFGQCRLDNNYYPLADADIDGCITQADYQIVFGSN